MDSVQVSLLVLGLVCVLSVQTGYGEELKCYECNSEEEYEGEICADSFDKDKAAKYLIACADKNDGRNYTMCRKMAQTIEGKGRIVRQCATEGMPDKCIDRTGTKAIKITYCECEGPGCNSANLLFSKSMVLLTVMSALLALICHS